MSDAGALRDVLPALICPVCGAALSLGARVTCSSGHSFDVARHGYLSLAVGRHAGTADTADMVLARERFFARGHYRPVTELVAAATSGTSGLVLDLAGGIGHYLAAVLDANPSARGVCVDLSVPALRRAARAHQRAAAIGADAWRPLPLADASVATALVIFGPRRAEELSRVLVPHGRLVVVTPTAEHLRELIEPLGMLGVDPAKDERRDRAFAAFEPRAQARWTAALRLDHAAVADLVGMGPTGAHLDADEIARRVSTLPDPVTVTASVDVTTYRRPPPAK